jgi:CheY-like chemotaxis protein
MEPDACELRTTIPARLRATPQHRPRQVPAPWDLFFRPTSADTTNVPRTLLLADDSVTIQRVIELTFADEDVQVIAVSDGDQAIARIDADPPDIVLADVGMPRRDGYEVAAHVKQTPALAHIPVLLLTGAFEPVDQARASAIGCDGVLAKPFEPQIVISRVKELLGSAAQAHSSAQPEPIDEPTKPETQPPAEDAPSQGDPFPKSLDDYFDRLDAAFADLSGRSSERAASPASRDLGEDLRVPTRDSEEAWAAVELGLSDPPAGGSAQGEPDRTSGSRAPLPERVADRPAVELSRPLPSLADAFAAILASERQEGTPETALSWPTGPSGSAGIGEDLIEQIVTQVLGRLSDRVVRETASEIVSKVAASLVREEIERIKASIE